MKRASKKQNEPKRQKATSILPKSTEGPLTESVVERIVMFVDALSLEDRLLKRFPHAGLQLLAVSRNWYWSLQNFRHNKATRMLQTRMDLLLNGPLVNIVYDFSDESSEEEADNILDSPGYSPQSPSYLALSPVPYPRAHSEKRRDAAFLFAWAASMRRPTMAGTPVLDEAVYNSTRNTLFPDQLEMWQIGIGHLADEKYARAGSWEERDQLGLWCFSNHIDIWTRYPLLELYRSYTPMDTVLDLLIGRLRCTEQGVVHLNVKKIFCEMMLWGMDIPSLRQLLAAMEAHVRHHFVVGEKHWVTAFVRPLGPCRLGKAKKLAPPTADYLHQLARENFPFTIWKKLLRSDRLAVHTYTPQLLPTVLQYSQKGFDWIRVEKHMGRVLPTLRLSECILEKLPALPITGGEYVWHWRIWVWRLQQSSPTLQEQLLVCAAADLHNKMRNHEYSGFIRALHTCGLLLNFVGKAIPDAKRGVFQIAPKTIEAVKVGDAIHSKRLTGFLNQACARNPQISSLLAEHWDELFVDCDSRKLIMKVFNDKPPRGLLVYDGPVDRNASRSVLLYEVLRLREKILEERTWV